MIRTLRLWTTIVFLYLQRRGAFGFCSFATTTPTRRVEHCCASCRRYASSNDDNESSSSWQPLDPESLVAAPCLIEQTLCQPSSDTQAQLAKDVDYAKAVLEAWKDEEDFSWEAEWKPVVYASSSNDDIDLHGYLIRRKPPQVSQNDDTIPAVVFFATAAGPHDLFLLYKAVSLVNSVNEQDCLVLIADLLGDDSGWGWNVDKSRYQAATSHVLAAGHENDDDDDDMPMIVGSRPVLQQRMQAALDYLATTHKVDRCAAFGWCFGGHAILETSRMPVAVRSRIKALATFHGVFDGLTAPTELDADTGMPVDVLICHGTEDPFVPEENLEQALATFQAHRFRTQLLQLSGAKHGFSSPAQAFNPNPAFGYNAEAAAKAWRQALNLIRQRLW